MSVMDSILACNKKFVENKDYEKYVTTKYPNKKDCNFGLYGYMTFGTITACHEFE